MDQTPRRPRGLLLLCLGVLLGLAPGAWAVESRFPESDDTRSLQVTTPDGKPLGDGTLTQKVEGDKLHVVLTYRYNDGRRIEEQAVFRQQPEIVQESWLWRERMGEQTTRQYAIDFSTGRASGFKQTGGDTRRFNEQLRVEPGRTFAGVGFAVAAKNLLPQLRQGRGVDLEAIAFTPVPRRVRVSLKQQGSERITRDGRTLTADRVIVHPELGIASLVVKAPDTELFFTGAQPPQLVAGQGPVLEPGDPIVRTLVLPRESAPAAGRRGPQQ
jgi:hypothetical protein